MTTPINRRLLNIPVGQIDLADSTYRLLPFADPDPLPASLRLSLERVGLLVPPVLKETAPHRYLVVTGWRRLRGAFELLGLKQCPCWVLPPDTPEEATLAHTLESILISRAPSPVERGLFFRKLLASLDEARAAEHYLPLFGLERRRELLAGILRLLELEEPLLIALHAGTLDEKVAEGLLGLSFPDRFALFDLIDYLELGLTNQKQLLTICRDLSTQAGRAVIDVLDRPAIKETIHHPRQNQAEKAAALMGLLEHLRDSGDTDAAPAARSQAPPH